jgi:hypothetical protein
VVTQTWFLRVTTRNRLTRRWIACAILAATIPIAAILPALAALGFVAITLATLAAYAPPLHTLRVTTAFRPYE